MIKIYTIINKLNKKKIKENTMNILHKLTDISKLYNLKVLTIDFKKEVTIPENLNCSECEYIFENLYFTDNKTKLSELKSKYPDYVIKIAKAPYYQAD